MKVKDYRIALCGAQGSGKTTLMNAVNKEFGSTIIQADTKSFMPPGITCHKDVLKMSVLEPEKGIEFQENLIRSRAYLFKTYIGGFITDRAVFDSLAYYLMHNSIYSTNQLDKNLIATTFSSLEDCDLTVFLSPRLNQVENNSTRVTSVGYYNTVTAVLKKLLTDAVMKKRDNLKFSSLGISDDVALDLIYWGKRCVAFLDEENTPNGIAPVEIRLKAIEKACNFIHLNIDL